MNIKALTRKINSMKSNMNLVRLLKAHTASKGTLMNGDYFFHVFIPSSDYYVIPYFDLLCYNNVRIRFSAVNSSSSLLNLMDRSKAARNLLCRNGIGSSKTSAKKHVFFFDGQYTRAYPELRDYLKKRYPGCKIVFHLGDLLQTKTGASAEKLLEFADLVVTYDHKDADRYGFVYHNDPYSILPNDVIPMENYESDVLFHGMSKDRSNSIISVYDVLKSGRLKCDFNIPDIKDEFLIDRKELSAGKYLSYLDYLSRVKKTKCIVELIQEQSLGCTFRTWEAIAYRRKLLTNNRSVVDEPFYDPDFIQVINDPADIDIEWIRAEKDVNYNYDLQLSPEGCFKFYIEYLNQKKEG